MDMRQWFPLHPLLADEITPDHLPNPAIRAIVFLHPADNYALLHLRSDDDYLRLAWGSIALLDDSRAGLLIGPTAKPRTRRHSSAPGDCRASSIDETSSSREGRSRQEVFCGACEVIRSEIGQTEREFNPSLLQQEVNQRLKRRPIESRDRLPQRGLTGDKCADHCSQGISYRLGGLQEDFAQLR